MEWGGEGGGGRGEGGRRRRGRGRSGKGESSASVQVWTLMEQECVVRVPHRLFSIKEREIESMQGPSPNDSISG